MNNLLNTINHLLSKKTSIIIAIDGRCASGKTTLAHTLSKLYDCNMIAMDDFFLPPLKRTSTRLNEAGGNIDYERFAQEVITPLSLKQNFTYQIYDCSQQALTTFKHITLKQVTIIEGTYSLHPYFKDIYDLKVFCDIDTTLQHKRILQRPKWKHERFFNEWIPYEQNYFNTFNIISKCDIILKGGHYESN